MPNLPDQPTPNGYERITQPIQFEGEVATAIEYLACKVCGAMVIYPVRHKNWHKKNGG